MKVHRTLPRALGRTAVTDRVRDRLAGLVGLGVTLITIGPCIDDKLKTRTITGDFVSLDTLDDWVSGACRLALPASATLAKKLAPAVDVVNKAVMDDRVVYGITTGFGGLSNAPVDGSAVSELQTNLLTFLAAGAGEEIESIHTRGAMVLRANVLLQGKSGIRAELVERLVRFVQRDAIPVVRSLGSIGASGDLVPLSTVARAITGQGGRVRVRLDGDVLEGQAVLQRLGLSPVTLRPKEGLALINGTSFSTAIAANAALAARHGLAVSFAIQSLLMTALKVNPEPFQPFVHACKPHRGQVWSARVMSQLLRCGVSEAASGELVQDRYALRCFPQYAGTLVDGFARVESVLETEMNSVSDNPLIDPDTQQFYQSGNFLGQYVALAMDDLRRYLGLLAKHLDVQIASLVAPEFNRGLSPSLRGNPQRACNMGLKGLQICGNSIVPLLTHLANPTVEHFPTHAEQFNQNINGLSWGSANLAWQSMQTFRQYLAVAALFAIQAVDLRAHDREGHYDGRVLLGSVASGFYEAVCRCVEWEPGGHRPYLFDDTDRWIEQDIARLAEDIAHRGKLTTSVQSITDDFVAFRKSHG